MRIGKGRKKHPWLQFTVQGISQETVEHVVNPRKRHPSFPILLCLHPPAISGFVMTAWPDPDLLWLFPRRNNSSCYRRGSGSWIRTRAIKSLFLNVSLDFSWRGSRLHVNSMKSNWVQLIICWCLRSFLLLAATLWDGRRKGRHSALELCGT